MDEKSLARDQAVDVAAPPESGTRLCAAPAMTAERAIAENMPLVHKLARRALRPGVEIEDLIAEGTLGLLTAARTWREDGGASFGTLAFYHVLHRVHRAGKRERGRGLVLGEDVKDAPDVCSLDAPLDDSGDGSLHDLIGEDEVEESLIDADALAKLRGAIESLGDADRAYVKGRLEGRPLSELRPEGRRKESADRREVRVVASLRRLLARDPVSTKRRHDGQKD